MIEVEELLVRCACGNSLFSNPSNLRLELALLREKLPSAFMGKVLGGKEVVGLKRVGGGLEEWKAALKADKDREEREMREERERTRANLMQALPPSPLRPRPVNSPAKRSLADVLGQLTPPPHPPAVAVQAAPQVEKRRQLYR